MQFGKAEYKAIITAINKFVEARYKDHTFSEGDDLKGYNNNNTPIIYLFNKEKKRIWFEVSSYDEKSQNWRYKVSPTNPHPPQKEKKAPRRAPSVKRFTHAPPRASNQQLPADTQPPQVTDEFATQGEPW